MLLTVSLLCIVTFIAGLIDSIAGGGGLLRLPALLIAGVSPQQALGTNKFTGAIGTGAAMLNFARKGLILWKLAFIGIPCALLGSAAGSKCILAFDPQTAGKILIALLPVAAMITLIPRRSKSCKDSFTSKDVYLLTPLICFSVGFYDGFFGPGAGSFFIIAFNVCLRMNLIQASALTKVFNLSSNLGSLFVFLYHGDVLFLYAIPMTVADVLGNLAGSQLAIRTGRLDRRSTDRTGHRSAAGAGTRVSDRGTAGRGGRAGTGGDGQRTRVCAAGVRSRADAVFG